MYSLSLVDAQLKDFYNKLSTNPLLIKKATELFSKMYAEEQQAEDYWSDELHRDPGDPDGNFPYMCQLGESFALPTKEYQKLKVDEEIKATSVKEIIPIKSRHMDGLIIEFDFDKQHYPRTNKALLLRRNKHVEESYSSLFQQDVLASDDWFVKQMIDALELKDGTRPLFPPEMVLDEENPKYALFEFIETPTLKEELRTNMYYKGGEGGEPEFSTSLGRITALRILLGEMRNADDYMLDAYDIIRPIDLGLGLYQDETTISGMAIGDYDENGNDVELRWLVKHKSWWDMRDWESYKKMFKNYKQGFLEANDALIKDRTKIIKIKRDALLSHPLLKENSSNRKKFEDVLKNFKTHLEWRKSVGSQKLFDAVIAYFIKEIDMYYGGKKRERLKEDFKELSGMDGKCAEDFLEEFSKKYDDFYVL